MLKTITESEVDHFLCINRNLKLNFTIGNVEISIVPYKAHFLVTVIGSDGIEIYQDWFNTWVESLDKFNQLCKEYIDIETKNNMQN